jgi:hypothetical protein
MCFLSKDNVNGHRGELNLKGETFICIYHSTHKGSDTW